jgi:hypothetical protein
MAAEVSEGNDRIMELASPLSDNEENAKDKSSYPALLLIVVGEPFSAEHKTLITGRIATGCAFSVRLY